MMKACIALMCTLGVAACGGEERPAQSPTTTTTSSETTTTTAQPSYPATSSTMTAPTTPSPAPTTDMDMTSPRTYAQPDTSMGKTGTTGTTGSSTTTSGTDATGLPAPSTMSPSTTPSVTGTDADNTKINERDRSAGALTPTDQGGGSDRNITAAVRRSLVADKALSFTAKNVKIITQGGKVTLRGTVKSDEEKASIEAKAKATPGVSSVDYQLDVKK